MNLTVLRYGVVLGLVASFLGACQGNSGPVHFATQAQNATEVSVASPTLVSGGDSQPTQAGSAPAYPPPGSQTLEAPLSGAYPPPAAEPPTQAPPSAGAYPGPESESPTLTQPAEPPRATVSAELHATDPGSVELSAGKVQLVEFFAFW